MFIKGENIKRIVILTLLLINTIYSDFSKNMNVQDLIFPIYSLSDTNSMESLYICNSSVDIDTKIERIATYLSEEENVIVPIILDSNYTDKNRVDSLLIVNNLNDKIIDNYNDNLETILQNGKQILYIDTYEKKTGFISINYNELKKQLRLTTQDTIIELNEFELPIYNFWNRSGRVLNFILTENIEIYNQLLNTCESINSITRIKACVIYNDEVLDEVEWVEFPQLITSGKFSIPLNNTRLHISPQKDGFWFSPDIYYSSIATLDREQIFQAYQKEETDDLVSYFEFNNNVDNKLTENKDDFLVHNVHFIKDETRGEVAEFDGESSYIDCGNKIKFGHKNEMSISVWIKPDKISENHAFVGKGLDFSFKVRTNSLTFTTADIKDHFISTIILDSLEWQHVAITVKENKFVKFYINGEFRGITDASQIIKSDKSLIIGSNLWLENYSGYMDDLKLWNRILNDSEILKIYQNSKDRNSQYNYLWMFSLIILIPIILYLKKKKIKPSISKLYKSQKKENIWDVEFFGGLRIKSKSGEMLQGQLSPKMKQILIVLLIKTIKSDGISTKQLNDIIWPGFTPENAKNNRSTYFRKIRNFLSLFEAIDIVYNKKKWQISSPDYFTFDYLEFMRSIENESIVRNEILLRKIISIISKGKFLPEMESEWLDNIRLDITNKLDSLAQHYYDNNNILKKPDLTYELANSVRKFDTLNETALSLQIKSQIILGNHSLAKKCFDAFQKEYKTLYDVDFTKKFQDFI